MNQSERRDSGLLFFANEWIDSELIEFLKNDKNIDW